MTTDTLATALITTCARFTRGVRHRTSPGRSTATWRALAILDEHGPLRVSEFAAHDQLTQPSATAMLRRLHDEGLLTRTPDPADGRASLVALSDAGHEQLGSRRAEGARAVAPLLDGLDDDQRRLLADAMTLLTDLMDSHDGTRPERTDA
ncbi:hypothetical protein GCM10027418_26850 [Mariniluteicoccus endophyticus]